jgi:4-aminobutyrate aminotransferase-like enzyme
MEPSHRISHLRHLDREFLSWSDGVHLQDRPIVASWAEGEVVHDLEGHSYIDTQMWHSACNFGYRNRAIDRALVAQVERLPQVSSDFLHPERLLLAKNVCDAIQERTGLAGRVGYTMTGTLAVEEALKIVRRHTGNNRMAVMTGAYHGRSLEASGLSCSSRYRRPFGEFADRAIMFPFADCARCPYEKRPEDCGTFCGRMIAQALESDACGLACKEGPEIGAFILEMCQGRGYTVPPRDFFTSFVPALQARGVLIVDDEVQAGLFRTGKLFAFEHYGIRPDIVILGKSLTNGLCPQSLIWAREGLADPAVFGPGLTHGTFSVHPLGTAAGLATWNYMLSRDYEQRLQAPSAHYRSGLERLKARHPSVGGIGGVGMMFSLAFADQAGDPLQGAAKRAVTLAQEEDYPHGGELFRMILSSGGNWGEVLKLAPCLDISLEEIDRTLAVLDQVISRLEAE